jgi:hypothetical protein
MPSNYNGRAQALLALIPSSVAISSTSATSPVVVTTSTPHGAETGDIVVIHGATAAINEEWECVVTGVSTLQLIGSSSGIAGGAVGTLHNANFGSDVQLQSGTDAFDIAGINVALEAVADRTSLLAYLMSYDLRLRAGGVMSVHNGATIEVQGTSGITIDGAGSIQADSGAQLTGLLTIGPGSSLNAGNLGTLGVNSGGFLTVSAGGRANIFGTQNIESGGQLVNLAGGLIDIKGRGATIGDDDGDVIARSGAIVEMKAGSFLLLDPGATLIANGPMSGSPTVPITLKGALLTMANVDTTYLNGSTISGVKTDNATTTQTGAILFSGDSGYVGGREVFSSTVTSGTDHIDPWAYEFLKLGSTLTGDTTWILSDTPNHERVVVTILTAATHMASHTLTIKDAHGNTLVVPDNVGGSVSWYELRFNQGSSTWEIWKSGKN